MKTIILLLFVLAPILYSDTPGPRVIGPTVEFVSKRFHMQEPNYFIFGFQGPDSSIRYKNQVKILISMGFNLVDWAQDSVLIPAGRDRVWFHRKLQITLGYRQKSFWNVYDGATSRPMYENNYSPSFYFSYQTIITRRLLPISFLGGYVHESNGNSGDDSRSWDRVYVGVSAGSLELNSTIAQLDLWVPWGMEENIGIWRHYGVGELTVYHKFLKNNNFGMSFSWKLAYNNINNAEFGIYGNPLFWTRVFKPTLYAQLYVGSGENMIDYQRRHACIRIGLATIF
jgi:outer membrane phospholipase A